MGHRRIFPIPINRLGNIAPLPWISTTSQKEQGRDHGLLPSFPLKGRCVWPWPHSSTSQEESGRQWSPSYLHYGRGMGITMTTHTLCSRGKRQRPWLTSLLPSRTGMGDGRDHTPPLLKIRRAETMATFHLSFQERKAMGDRHKR